MYSTRTTDVKDPVAPSIGSICSRTLWILLSAVFGLSFEVANADTFPLQLAGAWGGRAEYQGDDNPAVASKACESYKRNPKSVFGDIIVFRGSEKSSYGGYADYVDKNISVRQTGADQWQVTDRHYQDEEGGKPVGYRNISYSVSLNSDVLTIKEGKRVSRYNKCVEPGARPKENATSPPRDFPVPADSKASQTTNVRVKGCNIADVMFGPVEIQLIPHKGYETAIIVGNDYPKTGTSKFHALKGAIYGQIGSPARDGSRNLTNADGELCGRIGEDLVIDTSDSDCDNCDKTPVRLQLVPKLESYVVVRRDSIMGTVKGRLPK